MSKYLAEIGRKGGKASGKARMEKLTPEQRAAVARTAAAARWAKPLTQADLKRQSAARLADGAAVKPGKLTFDNKQKRATAAKKSKPHKKGH